MTLSNTIKIKMQIKNTLTISDLQFQKWGVIVFLCTF